MRAIVRDIGDLTDSRELLEAKPHPVIFWFLTILILLLGGAFTWTWFGEIDITVKARGIVRPNEKVAAVKNKVIGKVDAIHYKAGQHVKQGELLYSVERTMPEAELRSIEEELSRIKKDVESLTDFRTRLADGAIHASLDGLNDQMLQGYEAEHQLEMEWIGLMSQLTEKRESAGQLDLLEQSVLQRNNLFADVSSEYATQYADFELKRKKQEAGKRKTAEEFKIAVGQSDLAGAKRPVEEIQLSMDEYENEFLLQIRTKLQSLREQINGLEVQTSKIYSDLNGAIKQGEDKIFALEEKKKAVILSLEDFEVRAPMNGIVHVIKDAAKGELLQPGVEMVSIIPEEGSQFTVQLSLPNRDVADIHAGDRIKYHFDALPYKEYGEMSGTVRLISADAVSDPQGTGSFYIVEADIENRPLYSDKGEEASIRVGMACEAYIVTESKKILYYLLEKIDLRE